MALNKIPQKQIKSNYDVFETLEEQLNKVEDRTRVQANLVYNTKIQWDQGELDCIDTDSTLDTIQLSKENGIYETNGMYVSYVIDLGAINVAIESLGYSQNRYAGTSISYLTRTGNTEIVDSSWSEWQSITTEGIVQSPNSRYVQFKVVLATTDTSKTPKVSSVSFLIWGAPGLQEIYDARGGYKTLSDRFINLDTVLIIKTLTTEDMTEIPLNMLIEDTDRLMVYYGGALQNEGYGDEDTYTVIPGVNGSVVTFKEDILEPNGVVTCRIGGNGTSLVKEYTIFKEPAVGLYDGDNCTFTLEHTPLAYNSQVFYYGFLLEEGVTADYTLVGNSIIMNYPPDVGSSISVSYKYSL